jgi:hypothetical protein
MSPLWDEDLRPFGPGDIDQALRICGSGNLEAGIASLLKAMHGNRMPWGEMQTVLGDFMAQLERQAGMSAASLAPILFDAIEAFARKNQCGFAGIDGFVAQERKAGHVVDRVSLVRTLWYCAIQTNTYWLVPHAERVWEIRTSDAQGEMEAGYLRLQRIGEAPNGRDLLSLSVRNGPGENARPRS